MNMEPRFKVLDFVHATNGSVRYRIIDMADPGNPSNNEAYGDKAAAEAVRDQMLRNELNLSDWNRSLLRETRALDKDPEGREVFIGLIRPESERYIELMASQTPTESNEFIDLERRHTAARTGFQYEEDEV